jgi:uncharacterized protein YaeQ
VARHPSESEESRRGCLHLEFAEGIESRAACPIRGSGDFLRDLTGRIKTWIDVGTPDAARLHKAAKSGARVVVYTHKNPDQFLKQLSGEKIHRPDELELYAMDRGLVAALAARLDRRVAFSVSITDRELYLSITDTLTGAVTRLTIV